MRPSCVSISQPPAPPTLPPPCGPSGSRRSQRAESVARDNDDIIETYYYHMGGQVPSWFIDRYPQSDASSDDEITKKQFIEKMYQVVKSPEMK